MRPNGSDEHRLVADRASDELPNFLSDSRILFFSIQLPTPQDQNTRYPVADPTPALRTARVH